MRNFRLIFAFVLMSGMQPAADAETVPAQMNVTATVVANCRLTVPPLNFGAYDPLGTHSVQPDDSSVVLTVTCTRNTAASVSFDDGMNSISGGRALAGPSASRLEYQIFRDPARTQTWSTGTDAMRFLSSGISNPEQLIVFGRILPKQEVEPGAYIDVLTATVDF